MAEILFGSYLIILMLLAGFKHGLRKKVTSLSQLDQFIRRFRLVIYGLMFVLITVYFLTGAFQLTMEAVAGLLILAIATLLFVILIVENRKIRKIATTGIEFEELTYRERIQFLDRAGAQRLKWINDRTEENKENFEELLEAFNEAFATKNYCHVIASLHSIKQEPLTIESKELLFQEGMEQLLLQADKQIPADRIPSGSSFLSHQGWWYEKKQQLYFFFLKSGNRYYLCLSADVKEEEGELEREMLRLLLAGSAASGKEETPELPWIFSIRPQTHAPILGVNLRNFQLGGEENDQPGYVSSSDPSAVLDKVHEEMKASTRLAEDEVRQIRQVLKS
ncbi:hypothetical protein [Alkalicoccus saliphilus]|uniref:Uncharacterized protein n=1 Tax=Alkalicoccus saliphilus TaxID=200989 RepID=A0A2T4U286_9BACI|nr:hypothetical protein [Alkalicoccus saliphilus]PTL37519.1 hypothetical protein C6Y45_16105 [Alkalicoccus saliphilus]